MPENLELPYPVSSRNEAKPFGEFPGKCAARDSGTRPAAAPAGKAALDLRAVASRFHIYGEFRDAQPYGTGHINDTFCVRFSQSGAPVRYIFQRINRRIFRDPAALMRNIRRVTEHLGRKLGGAPDGSRTRLTLIPTWNGACYDRDAAGDFWRAYFFIENARTYDVLESPGQAFHAARSFGSFQRLLADLPHPALDHTIPDFHHTPKRFAALERAVERDAANRAQPAAAEIEFALKRREIPGMLLAAGLPERVTHNDTKLNNVMLDDATGQGVCVIDLDTVMPGLAPYDFGDMVRTGTSPAAEDERDLSKVTMQFHMFEALARGYLDSAGEFLTKAERQSLPAAGKVITFEIGLRFLTDFLEGDSYFKVRRPAHNLDRCRAQFKLVESIERQEERMSRFVECV